MDPSTHDDSSLLASLSSVGIPVEAAVVGDPVGSPVGAAVVGDPVGSAVGRPVGRAVVGTAVVGGAVGGAVGDGVANNNEKGGTHSCQASVRGVPHMQKRSKQQWLPLMAAHSGDETHLVKCEKLGLVYSGDPLAHASADRVVLE